MTEITHECPPKGASLTPCCGTVPFELPHADRLTLDRALVTCVSDPSETQALIEEYRLTLEPVALGGWHAKVTEYTGEWGSTIGEAVRACVERIRNGQ